MSEISKTKNEIILIIKRIIARISNKDNLLIITASQIEDNEDITLSKLLQLDSLKAIMIVVEIEKAFKISVPDEELDLENFRTPLLIASYVMKILNYN